MTTTSILFVGESPPAGAPPDFRPFDCASGTRLATIMLGLRDRDTLLQHVPRANIYPVPAGVKGSVCAWVAADARLLGTDLLASSEHATATVFVALGRRTAEALGMPDPIATPKYNWAPPVGATWGWSDGGGHGDGVTIIYAPHPSGQSQALNDATTRAEVRAMLMPELVLGIPSLRPWHFRLNDPGTIAALAAALSPLCPALGAAALLHAEGMHKALTARVSCPLLANISHPTRTHESPMPGPWDQPLRLTAAALLQHDGARVLARRWGMSKDGALAAAAKEHAHMNAAQSRSAMRATIARYAAAGLA